MKKIKLIYIACIHLLLRLYWFIVRPSGKGVKVVLRSVGKVLMVRHNYGHKLWTIPGGGVKRGESLEVAARREIQEELGILVAGVTHIGTYETNYEYKQVTVDCFAVEVQDSTFKIDDFEIAEAAWFTLDALPDNRAESVTKIISLYKDL